MSKLKNIFIFTIIIIPIYIFIKFFFLTPIMLSNNIYGLKFGTMKFIYIDQNKKLKSFSFNHRDYDGDLMAYNIKNGLVDYVTEKKNINVYNFKSYQYLSEKKILKYSRFVSSVSFLLNEMITCQKRKIKVVIIVSKRDKLKNYQTKGNFIDFAYFQIDPSDSFLKICSKCQQTIKNIKSNQIKRANLNKFLFLFSNVDYVFNSWRSLTVINTINNDLLLRRSTTNILEQDILRLKCEKKRTFINLDFLNNRYIISEITPF